MNTPMVGQLIGRVRVTWKVQGQRKSLAGMYAKQDEAAENLNREVLSSARAGGVEASYLKPHAFGVQIGGLS